jgi:hypothetical protein
MLRVNDLCRDQMPVHQRDLPQQNQLETIHGDPGFHGLALMVAWYVVAMFGSILLLGYLTAPKLPNTGTASASASLQR